MAETFQVTHHRPDNWDADRRLQGLGGVGGWYRDIDTLIRAIEAKTLSLWTTTTAGQSVWVVVAQRANGRKYLKTQADGIEPNNLLKLPVC